MLAWLPPLKNVLLPTSRESLRVLRLLYMFSLASHCIRSHPSDLFSTLVTPSYQFLLWWKAILTPYSHRSHKANMLCVCHSKDCSCFCSSGHFPLCPFHVTTTHSNSYSPSANHDTFATLRAFSRNRSAEDPVLGMANGWTNSWSSLNSTTPNKENFWGPSFPVTKWCKCHWIWHFGA